MENIAAIVQSLLPAKGADGSWQRANLPVAEPANRAQPHSEKAPFITFPVSIGLLEGKHVEAMGIAVWCFLWCINRVTSDRTDPDGERWGQVLGGCRFNHQRIADELGISLRAVRYQMDRLRSGGYLRITRCQDGQQVEVRHSIKWLRRKTQGAPNSRPELPPQVKKLPDIDPPVSVPAVPVNPVFSVAEESVTPEPEAETAKVFSLAEALRRKQWEREQGLRE